MSKIFEEGGLSVNIENGCFRFTEDSLEGAIITPLESATLAHAILAHIQQVQDKAAEVRAKENYEKGATR